MNKDAVNQSVHSRKPGWLFRIRPITTYVLHRLFPDRLQLKGKVTRAVSGVHDALQIYFDQYGVPHIRAKNEADAFFGLGYMHARDRRFQMELFKLLAYGRLCKLVGGGDSDARLAERDLFNRALKFGECGRHIVESASSRDREILAAYAAGINQATQRERVPLEFRLLDAEPEEWTLEDSATLIAWFSFSLRKNWEFELGRLELIWHQLSKGGSIERALEIWKPRYSFPPHLIANPDPNNSFDGIPPIAPELAEYLCETAPQRDQAHFQSHAAGSDVELVCGIGSNAWAVSGRWTGTGHSALAADPHLPLSLPPAAYLAHLQYPAGSQSTRVIGGGFPGIPAILFGTNGNVAWGVTVNWADVTDVYVEKPVAGTPERYWAGTETLPFRVENEWFEARTSDGGRSRTQRTVRYSHHGPILNDLLSRLAPDLPLVALKQDRELGAPLSSMRALYLAHTTTEAGEALRQMRSITGHWILADAQGHIGYEATMGLPKRTRHLGTVPVPGWTGTYEWEEMVSAADLPRIEKLAAEFVAAANNQMSDPDAYEWPINFEGDVPFRYMRLQERLGAGSNGAPVADQMRELQLDGRDLSWDYIRPLWLPALEPLEAHQNSAVAAGASILLAWDGDHSTDSPAPLLFHTLCADLLHRTLKDEMPAATIEFVCNHHNVEPFVFDIIGNPENPVWQPLGGATHAVQTAFIDTIARLRREHGPDVLRWTWSGGAPFILRHPMGTIPALSSYLNRGPLPLTGSPNSVNKHQFLREPWSRFSVVIGPVLRINVDLADLESSTMSVPGGQSGRPASRHYDDLIPLFLAGKGVSMTLDMERVTSEAAALLQIIPQTVRA